MRVTLHDSFDFLSPEYAGLFAHSRASVFQHPIWLDALYRELVPARQARPAVLAGRDERHGRLDVVLPLILRRKSGILLLESADLGVSDYSAPVVRDGLAAHAGLRAAIAQGLPDHDLLRIRPVRSESVQDWQDVLGGKARPLGFAAHATQLAPTHAEWRTEAMNGSFMRYLDRKNRRFFKLQGAALHLLSEAGEIRNGIDALQRVRRGRFEGDLLQQDFVRDFYAEIAGKGAEAGFARIYSLRLGEEAVAHVFGLTHEGRFHNLLIGCDYQRFGKYSPGLVVCDAIIAEWIAAGGKVFDFTIGDELYKRDFGTAPTPMHEILKPKTIRGWLAYATLRMRAAAGRLRESRAGQGNNSWG